MDNPNKVLDEQMWILKYASDTTCLNDMRSSSEPVRIGDTIKELMKDWKYDRIEP